MNSVCLSEVTMQRYIITGGNPKIKNTSHFKKLRYACLILLKMLTLEHLVKIQKSMELMYCRSQNWQQIVQYKQNIYNLTV